MNRNTGSIFKMFVLVPYSVASLCTSPLPMRLHAESSSEVHHSLHLGCEVLACSASSKYAFSSQMVAVLRSWVSQSSSRAEWLNLCFAGSMRKACLISCLCMISTHPLPENLDVLLERVLPPWTQHRPLVGVPLHTCF